MICISITYYLCHSYLYFLIDICTYVVIDIINLFINVIQLGDCCILYKFYYIKYYSPVYYYFELKLINKLYYLLASNILHNCY